MRIALVATYTHPLALGLRYISSFLKRRGDDVEILFMRSKHRTAEANFTPALLDEFAQRLRSADLIGMSLMTNTFYRACALTKAVRKAQIAAPVIWGGPHPTTAIEESLDEADMVCVGEGEAAMLSLVEALEDGRDPTSIAGLAFRRNGRTVQNPVAHLEQKLDDYPYPDFDPSGHWVAKRNHFEPATPENLLGILHRYRIETTRGCPFSCTFCTNAAMLNLYKSRGQWVRKRSSENIVDEIELARARFPTIEAVNIIDDLFFVRSEAEMEEFCRLYESRVNLPLEMDAHPSTISREKVRLLSRLPISLISMGIQSGSPETLKQVYHRPTPIDSIVNGINALADHNIRAEYHYLINNPFESDRHRIETLRFAASHHRGPAKIRVFPLQFYPGTPLYDRARAEGVVGDRDDSAYTFGYTGKTRILDSGYLDIWLYAVLGLRNIGVPRTLVHGMVSVVVHPWVRWAADRKWFPPVAYGVFSVGRFISRNVIRQLIVRPLQRLRKKPKRGRASLEKERSAPREPAPRIATAHERDQTGSLARHR